LVSKQGSLDAAILNLEFFSRIDNSLFTLGPISLTYQGIVYKEKVTFKLRIAGLDATKWNPGI
jgi:hypothetical protein